MNAALVGNPIGCDLAPLIESPFPGGSQESRKIGKRGRHTQSGDASLMRLSCVLDIAKDKTNVHNRLHSCPDNMSLPRHPHRLT